MSASVCAVSKVRSTTMRDITISFAVDGGPD
jgi:hypothetical protein